MRILVTGGAGFIGSHLVDALVARKHRVVVLDNLSSGRKEFVHPKAVLHRIDVATPAAEKLVRTLRPEVIYHLAAQKDVRFSVTHPVADARSNVLGLLYLVQGVMAIGGVQRFVFASTGGAIYGGATELPTTETYPARPLSPYGASKLASEHYLHAYRDSGVLPATCLRFANVYGPRQTPKSETGVVAVWAEALQKGKRPVVYGDGKQTRDFVYVDDVVTALLLALHKGSGETINIGTGRETSINQLLQLMRSSVPGALAPKHAPARSGEERRSVISPKRANRVLGWKAKTPLADGIRKTLLFVKHNAT